MKPGVLYFDLAVDGFDDEGRGRTVVDGWDFAVRGALPGEIVNARVERSFDARKLVQLGALAVSRRSALHVDSACPHEGPCPGCPLDGVDEGFVRELKRARVEQALAEVGIRALVDDVVPALAPRQKVKLTAGIDQRPYRRGRLQLGLYVPHTHELTDAWRCPHHDARIERALEKLVPALESVEVHATLKAVIARAFVEGVGVVLVTSAPVSGDSWRALGALVDADPIASLAVRVDDGAGGSTNSLLGGTVQRFVGPQALTPLESLVESATATSSSLAFSASVDAFCQSDPALASWLYARVAAFLVDTTEGTAVNAAYLDAYAGAGGFTRALLARGASHVVAVERAPASAAALRALSTSLCGDAGHTPTARVHALESSVEDALAAPALRERAFRGVVVDPPKSGLKDAAGPLAALGAPRVALVACDPDAGARDVKVFVDAGYRIVDVIPIDLFPATVEVETLFLLVREA